MQRHASMGANVTECENLSIGAPTDDHGFTQHGLGNHPTPFESAPQ